jgi:outer membrane protein assembly factor BamB
MKSTSTLETLRDLIARRAVLFGDKHRLTSPSGEHQSWLIDMRTLLLSSSALDAIGELFWTRFESELPFQVGGLEMAAVPIVSAILLTAVRRGHTVEGFIVHKERKLYGRMRAIENDLEPVPIIVVDDIFNSGNSIEKVRTALAAIGRSIWQVWCIIDFGSRTGQEWSNRHGIPVSSVFSLGDFNLAKATRSPKAVSTRLIPRWQRALGTANPFHSVPKSAPRCQNGRILIGSEAGALLCFDGASGERLWSFQTGQPHGKGIWSTPCLVDRLAIFGSYDGNLYAVDIETGREVWRNVEADWIGSSPCHARELGLVFVGLEHATPERSGGIAAFDLVTGAMRWELPTVAFVHASPQYDCVTGTVICGTNDGLLLALDAASGHVRWRVETDAAIKNAPAIDSMMGVVVVGCFDGTIRCFDLGSGTTRFVAKTGNTVYTTPLIENGRIYCGSTDKSFYVIDLKTGDKIAALPISAKVFSSPRRVGDWIWFGATDGRIRALDPLKLSIVSDTQLPEAITSEIGYDARHDRLVVATNGGSIHSFSVFDRHATHSGHGENKARTQLSALQLARLTVSAFIDGLPLPDPNAFEVLDHKANGGAFASLRDRQSGERLAREGHWIFEGQACPAADSIVLATAKACATVALDRLTQADVGLAMIGPIELATVGELDTQVFGIVVRSESGMSIGGALPNSPEYANESGQYLHALRNARLEIDSRHQLYRHTVTKYVESATWPPFGAPAPWLARGGLDAFAAWLLDESAVSDAHDCSVQADIRAVALTHYIGGRVATVLHSAHDRDDLRSRVRTTIDEMQLATQRAPDIQGGIVLSVLTHGKRIPGSRQLGNRTLRLVSDAVLRVAPSTERTQLPTITMQMNMRAADIEARLRKTSGTHDASGGDDRAYWEICPCHSWLLNRDKPIAIEGALTRTDAHTVRLDSLLDATLAHALARFDSLTPSQVIYFPVTDAYTTSPDGEEQYIAWLAAIAAGAQVRGRIDVHERCVTRIDTFIAKIATERARWQPGRRAALRALLSCSSTCFGAHLDWVTGFGTPSDNALAIRVALKAAQVEGRRDLREWRTPVAAGLGALRRSHVSDAESWAAAASELIAAGHDELVPILIRSAQQIAIAQLPASGAFVAAMNASGPTAATATLTQVLSIPLGNARNDGEEVQFLRHAWQRSLVALDALRIRPTDAFCLKNPARAIDAIRDSQGACIASAMSCAAVLNACAHACSIGLDDTRHYRPSARAAVLAPTSGAHDNVVELD